MLPFRRLTSRLQQGQRWQASEGKKARWDMGYRRKESCSEVCSVLTDHFWHYYVANASVKSVMSASQAAIPPDKNARICETFIDQTPSFRPSNSKSREFEIAIASFLPKCIVLADPREPPVASAQRENVLGVQVRQKIAPQSFLGKV